MLVTNYASYPKLCMQNELFLIFIRMLVLLINQKEFKSNVPVKISLDRRNLGLNNK